MNMALSERRHSDLDCNLQVTWICPTKKTKQYSLVVLMLSEEIVNQ
jgi:hypothetical protein